MAANGANGGGAGPVLVSRSGAVTTIRLNRPEVRNAVDGPTAAALVDAFVGFETEPAAHVAVLAGVGGAFCSGADLRALGTERANQVTPDGDGPMGPTRMVLSKPVIAAIAGPAVAGGLELALWCDLRIAEEDAVFGVFNRRWGVPLVDGGTVRLPRLIGAGRALDLVLTGRPVDAAEALAIGLVTRVVPRGAALAEATALAERIAAFPPAALRHDRLSLHEQAGMTEADAMANEFRHGEAALASVADGSGVGAGAEAGDGAAAAGGRAGVPAGVARFLAGEGRHGSFEE